MERLTGNQAKSLMEAYAQIYSQPKVEMLNEKIGIGPERERIPMSSGRLTIPGAKREAEARRQLAKDEADSKAQAAQLGDAPARETGVPRGQIPPGATLTPKGAAAVETILKLKPGSLTTNNSNGSGTTPVRQPVAQPVRQPVRQPVTQQTTRPAPAPAQTFKVGDKQMTKAQINKEYQRLRQTDPKAAEAFGKDAFRATNKPATGTLGKTSFERRTPTSAELKAAQIARKSGATPEQALQKAKDANEQSSVDAALKAARARDTAPAPAGSALAKQQQAQGRTVTGSGAMGSAANPQVRSQLGLKPINPQPNVSTVTSEINRVKANINAAGSNLSGANALKLKPKPEVQTQSVDLFDIIKGEFIEEGYSEEETVYIMANLNEEQLNEIVGFLRKQLLKNKDVLLKKASKLPVVGDLVNRARGIPPLPKIEFESPIRTRAQDVVRSQRLGVSGNADELNQMQQAAQSSLDRMSTFRQGTRRSADLNAKSLERQVRRANAYGPQTSSSKPFAQVIEPPKPTGSKPGVVKLDRYGNSIKEEFVNENLGRLAARVIQGAARTSPHVYGKAVNAIRNTGASRLIPDMNVAPGVVRRTGQGMGIRPIRPAGPKPPLNPETRLKVLPDAKFGDLVMATPGGKPPAVRPKAPAPKPDPDAKFRDVIPQPPASKPSPDLPANPMGARASSTEAALNTLRRNRRGRVVR